MNTSVFIRDESERCVTPLTVPWVNKSSYTKIICVEYLFRWILHLDLLWSCSLGSWRVMEVFEFLSTAQHRCGACAWKEAIWTESSLHLCGRTAETFCPPQVPDHDRGETWTSLIIIIIIIMDQSAYLSQHLNFTVSKIFLLSYILSLFPTFFCFTLPAAVHLLLHRLSRPAHHHSSTLPDPRPSLLLGHHPYHSLVTGRHPVPSHLGRPPGREAWVCD